MDYLGPADEFPSASPASGVTHGNNKRLMAFLSCRKEGNIIFLIDTSSPHTFVCGKAMNVMIQSENIITCHLSPHDKHFADIFPDGKYAFSCHGLQAEVLSTDREIPKLELSACELM